MVASRCHVWNLGLLCERRDPCHRGHDLPEAAGSPRITYLACAATGVDVLADPLDGCRPARGVDFHPDAVLALTKAVTHHAVTERLLLPDRYAPIHPSIHRPGLIEIHDVARGIRTEVVLI